MSLLCRLPLNPLSVRVPAFDLDSALEIIRSRLHSPDNLNPDVHDAFVRNIVKAVIPMTRDVNDIQMMVESILAASLPKLTALADELEENGDLNNKDVLTFRTFSVAGPEIREAVKRVHLRSIG